MGPNKFEIPDHFTVDFLLEQNAQGKTDQMIADELFISKALLQNWKKQIGWVPFSGKNISGRKAMVDINLIAEMRSQGIKRKDIAEATGICINNVDYHLRKMNMTRKRA
ncbi:hypothetical protein M3204_14040 [Mesobacillus subterraneus]|uniref:hypothetical protein n=1 Tax=Mesobacillus subterraneus TaxID=285983 RepID=UPI00203E67F7|nr:hypothetical protein [Mesobacillus subterraneus]MCM3665534.1 hypothetical protein [Mesobacillus subterraneus]MCM3686093.1 hypothetical protein [Mesobacillus subterraneus]